MVSETMFMYAYLKIMVKLFHSEKVGEFKKCNMYLHLLNNTKVRLSIDCQSAYLLFYFPTHANWYLIIHCDLN